VFGGSGFICRFAIFGFLLISLLDLDVLFGLDGLLLFWRLLLAVFSHEELLEVFGLDGHVMLVLPFDLFIWPARPQLSFWLLFQTLIKVTLFGLELKLLGLVFLRVLPVLFEFLYFFLVVSWEVDFALHLVVVLEDVTNDLAVGDVELILF
jgi:hypothetical protein